MSSWFAFLVVDLLLLALEACHIHQLAVEAPIMADGGTSAEGQAEANETVPLYYDSKGQEIEVE